MFSDWLTKELDKRKMSQAELARLANVSRAAISNLLNDTRQPGPEILLGIAKALKLPPEFVFRRAGLLPEEKNKLDEIFQEMAAILETLGDNDRDEILKFARFRLQLQDEKPPYRATKDSPTTPRP